MQYVHSQVRYLTVCILPYSFTSKTRFIPLCVRSMYEGEKERHYGVVLASCSPSAVPSTLLLFGPPPMVDAGLKRAQPRLDSFSNHTLSVTHKHRAHFHHTMSLNPLQAQTLSLAPLGFVDGGFGWTVGQGDLTTPLLTHLLSYPPMDWICLAFPPYGLPRAQTDNPPNYA